MEFQTHMSARRRTREGQRFDVRLLVWYSSGVTPKLSDEQREAIESKHGGPIEVRDDRTQHVYVLVGRDQFQQLVEEQLRRDLQIGFDQADAGDVAAWNVEEVLQAARRP